MVLSLEGKNSSLPVLRVFTVLLFNKCEGFPALLVGTITAEETRALGLALLTGVEMPRHLTRALAGVSCPSRSVPSAWRGAGMPCCSAIGTHGRPPQHRAPAGGFGNCWT